MMKLFKLVRLVGDHSKSMFEPEFYKPPSIEVMAGEPMTDLINRLVFWGYTPYQAQMCIQAWAAHAKFDLNQAPRGVRVYCEMCMSSMPKPGEFAPQYFWPIVIAIAAIAAVGLALYLWVELDTEMFAHFGAHPWAYVATYQQRMYIAEIISVGPRGTPTYEIGASLGNVIAWHEWGASYVDRWLDRLHFYMALKHEGRPTIFYHRFLWHHWDGAYLGLMYPIGPRLYRLKGNPGDPYAPGELWYRPGGRMYTPQYEGCWKDWWWL